MKHLCSDLKMPQTVLCLILFVGLRQIAVAQDVKRKQNGAILLENFQDDTVGTYPDGWYDRDGNAELKTHSAEDLKNYHYSVQEEGGNKYLHYEGKTAMHINFPLVNRDKKNIYNINLKHTPVLSWDWRVKKLPDGANEDDKNRNDTAASIYVVFDLGHVLFKKVPKTIRYTWSSTLPEGETLSKFFGNQKLIVLKSGKNELGKWVHFQQNIVKDYKRLFGDAPPEMPLAILILSDGNSTGHTAEADIDNIMLQPAAAAAR